MFCSNCGKEITNGVNFCPSCGSSLKKGTIQNGNQLVNLTITREKSVLGCAIAFKVFVDGTEIGKLKNNSSLACSLAQGTHEVIIKCAEQKLSQQLNVDSNITAIEIIIAPKVGALTARPCIKAINYSTVTPQSPAPNANTPQNTNVVQNQVIVNQPNENTNKGFNKSAVFSFICSLVSIIVLWWVSLGGIMLGIQALNEIKTSKAKGKVLAIIGIIIGVIGLIIYFARMVMDIYNT